MMFPLTLKGTFHLDRFVIGPIVGAYVPLSLSPDYDYSFPLGFTAGADLGIHWGPGLLFLDIRYSQDIGEFRQNEAGKYRRGMLSMSLGYLWGFFRR
jgi:hypothetical protein